MGLTGTKTISLAAADNNIKHLIFEGDSFFHTKNKSPSSNPLSKIYDFSNMTSKNINYNCNYNQASNPIKQNPNNYKSNSVDNKKIISDILLEKKNVDNNINMHYIKPLYNNNIDSFLMKFDDIKRNPIFVNLLHYDEMLTNKENQKYYKYFKLNIVGGYYGINNFDIFTKYIEAINNSKMFLRYVLIISGSKANKILNLCYNYSYIDDIIIFCYSKDKYSFLAQLDKIKLIANSFNDVISYLKTKIYTKNELDMSNQIPSTPLITFYEYKYCYFSFHRIIAKFFNENWLSPQFIARDRILVTKFLGKSNFPLNLKKKILEIMDKLLKSNNFTRDCIRYYTSENLCYIFNKTLRDIGKNFDGMSHFVGPFDYALFKYLHDNPNKGLTYNITLFRDVQMSIFDFYLYYLSLNDIICLPSFTSTTVLKNLNFKNTFNAKIVNNSKNSDFHIKMIFKYYYDYGNVSPGIFIRDESKYSNEEEVLLFPFTFVKITNIVYNKGTINNKHEIYFDIVNRNRIMEFELLKNRNFYLSIKNNKIIFN